MSDFPDWSINPIIRGLDAEGNPRGVRVDEQGRLMSLLHALYNSTPVGLKCDPDGNLLLNLKAQDLLYTQSKPYYGDGRITGGYVSDVGGPIWTKIFEITGKIRVFGGVIYSDENMRDHCLRIVLDGVTGLGICADTPVTHNVVPPCSFYIRALCYDTVNNIYCYDLLPGLQAESSLRLEAMNNVSDLRAKIWFCVTYALAE